MLVHYTHKDGVVISVTLEQESTEPKTFWAREAGAFIQKNYPGLPLHRLLRCPINTSGPRAATLTLRMDLLDAPDEGI